MEPCLSRQGRPRASEWCTVSCPSFCYIPVHLGILHLSVGRHLIRASCYYKYCFCFFPPFLLSSFPSFYPFLPPPINCFIIVEGTGAAKTCETQLLTILPKVPQPESSLAWKIQLLGSCLFLTPSFLSLLVL